MESRPEKTGYDQATQIQVDGAAQLAAVSPTQTQAQLLYHTNHMTVSVTPNKNVYNNTHCSTINSKSALWDTLSHIGVVLTLTQTHRCTQFTTHQHVNAKPQTDTWSSSPLLVFWQALEQEHWADAVSMFPIVGRRTWQHWDNCQRRSDHSVPPTRTLCNRVHKNTNNNTHSTAAPNRHMLTTRMLVVCGSGLYPPGRQV